MIMETGESGSLEVFVALELLRENMKLCLTGKQELFELIMETK